MSDFFKNKQKMTLAFGAFFMVATLIAGSFAYLTTGMPVVADASEGQQSSLESLPGELLPAGEEREGDGWTEDWEAGGEGPLANYNVPEEMRGVILTPGTDFLAGDGSGREEVLKEIAKALESAAELGFNTVVIDTGLEDKVIYHTVNAPLAVTDYDVMEALTGQARDMGFYLYAIVDVSHYTRARTAAPLAVGAGEINTLGANLREFLGKYPVDGILIDGYTNGADGNSYGLYSLLGGGVGFSTFMKQSPAAVVNAAAQTVRQYGNGIQAGLLADPVWANGEEVAEGSATKATYTALGDGNADTKTFVEKGMVDFLAVKAYGSLTDAAIPFEEVVGWWAGVAGTSNTPLYVVHAADKLAGSETGWGAADQLNKQLAALEEIPNVEGSIFNHLGKLSSNPSAVSYEKTVNAAAKPPADKPAETTASTEQPAVSETAGPGEDTIPNDGVPTTPVSTNPPAGSSSSSDRELEITKPQSTSYTTKEASVTFTGASDPGSSVAVNGAAVQTDASGYFSVTKELTGGLNEFTVTHKGKSVTYRITREVDILRDVSPTGAITTEGGVSLTISAWAYEQASVRAVINGTTVTMKVDDSMTDEVDRDSSFRLFTGKYTVPAAGSSEQNLGAISVTASWGGESKTLGGATVKVNPKSKIEDGVPVVVVADQAKTYPGGTLDNVPSNTCYPLPKGAMDYAVGDEIVYKKDNKTYTYSLLASGVRVETKDIAASSDYPANNAISGMDVTSRDGYTYVTLSTAQQVSYSFAYAGGGVTVTFHNTTQVPSGASLSSNPIFSSAEWSAGNTLYLKFLQNGGFMGYKGYYDGNGNLVLRFTNPPASLSGARIAIDPGHGGKDSGTKGFLTDYPEKTINREIADYLARELESRGATVLLIDTSGSMELEERVRRAEEFNAHLMVSVHNNSAQRESAQGTETYYFYPYGKNLAVSAAANVSRQLSTENRGARSSYYHVTLSAQVPSVLVECGFMSNQEEYEKLIDDRYQQAIATGIADSLSEAIKAAYTGSTVSGSQSMGSGADTAAGSGVTVEDLVLDQDEIQLDMGESRTLVATAYPKNAGTAAITWSSGNTAVAKVDANGRVTGVRTGKTTVTAKANGDAISVSCTVVVTEDGTYDEDSGNSAAESGSGTQSTDPKAKTTGVALNSVEWYDFDTGSLELYIQSSKQLLVYSEEDEVINPTDFVWRSNSSSVAKVDDYGVVTALKKTGTATITAKPKDTSVHRDEVAVKVTVHKNKVTVTGIALNKTSITVNKGQVYKDLEVTFTPSNATVTEVTWKSGNEKIAKVDSNGNVTGMNRGTTTLTVTSKDGRYKATCSVEVQKATQDIDYLDLSDYQLEMWVGEEELLTATVYPENAADRSVTWTSSNTKVVTVDAKGNIKAVGRGSAVIRATSKADPNCYEECEIFVDD